jgi:LPPG:FO 2-phospho-L-lactate transferase
MIVALAGGVGGAKLADGLYRELPPGELTVVVNTADDLTMHGLHISPDLDTVLYTLSGLANPDTGWGIKGDSFQGLEMLARLGGPDWFRLGDQDLATHITRTRMLRDGMSLTQVTAALVEALGVRACLLPMCNERVATMVETPDGVLGFQEYFVQRGCRDTVLGLRFAGLEQARPTDDVLDALANASALLICPSNPYVSVGPILALPGVRDLLRRPGLPIVAVSPIIGGQAVRGPAARMLESLGQDVSAYGVAMLYADLQPTLLIDEADAGLAPAIAALGVRPVIAPILMQSLDDRRVLARRVLDECFRELGLHETGQVREALTDGA